MAGLQSFSGRFSSLEVTGVRLTGRRLGKGSDATVEEVEWQGTLCAAKILHEILLDDDSPGGSRRFVEGFEKECLTWSKLSHPHVAQFLGVYFIPGSAIPILLLEKMDTSLRTFLEESQREDLLLSDNIFILLQVVQGLAYLHSRKPALVHHDLSPNNILLNRVVLLAKLTDFGMSRVVDPSGVSHKSSVKGTLAFMSPEALVEPPRYDENLDVFSFGNVIITTLTHAWPNPGAFNKYQGNQIIALTEFERREQYIILFSPGESAIFHAMVRSCLENRPNLRPTSLQLVDQMRQIEKDHPRKKLIGGPAVIEQLHAQLLAKDTQLCEKDTQLLAQDSQLHKKDTQLLAKDTQLREKDTQLLAKDTQLNKKDTQLLAKDTQLQEIGTQLQEKDTQLQEKGTQLLAKDTQLREKDTQLLTKDTQLNKKDTQLLAKNTQLKEIGTQLQEKDTQLQEIGTQLQEKDTQLQEKGTQLQERGTQLQEKGTQLQEKDTQIAKLLEEIQRLKQVSLASSSSPAKRFKPVQNKVFRSDLVRPGEHHSAKMPSLLIPTCRATPVTIGRDVYLAGGGTDEVKNDMRVQVYNMDSGNCRTLPPSPQYWSAAVVIDSTLVLIGGRSFSTHKPTNMVSTWMAAEERWTQALPPMKMKRSRSGVLLLNNHLFVFGGLDEDEKTRLDCFEVLDLNTKQWREGLGSLPQPLSTLQLGVFRDYVMLYGGYISEGAATNACYTVPVHVLVDSVTNPMSPPIHWTPVQDAPYFSSALLTTSQDAVLIGGQRDCQATRAIHRFSSSGSWEVIGELSKPRLLPTLIAVSDRSFLVLGGCSDPKNAWKSLLKSVKLISY